MTDWRATANTVTVVLFALALVCAVFAGVALFDLDDGVGTRPPTNGSADSPGLGYAGVVGAQEAEVRDEYDAREFETRLTETSSNESRAMVIANETRRLEASLDALETRRSELRADDDGRAYRSQVTSFVAQSVVFEQRLDRVQRAAETLSPSVRERFDVTAEAFESLRDRTDALVTPEMRAVAQEVAGDDVGDDFDDDADNSTDDDDQSDASEGSDDESDTADDEGDGDDTEGSGAADPDDSGSDDDEGVTTDPDSDSDSDDGDGDDDDRGDDSETDADTNDGSSDSDDDSDDGTDDDDSDEDDADDGADDTDDEDSADGDTDDADD